MAEEKNKCNCPCCSMGMGHYSGTHMLFKLLLAVILLILVFWFGVRLGELRESIRGYNGGYGYHASMGGGYGPMIPYGAQPMTSPATPTTGGSASGASNIIQ